MKNWKKYTSFIGIVIFIYLLFKINVKNVLYELTKANLLFLILALAIVPFVFFVETYKWFYIAKKQKIGISLKEAFKINLISNFYGFVTPAKIGSIIKIEYLKKYTKNIGKGVSNFVLDKILDLCSIVFLGIVFSFIFRDKIFISFSYLIILFITLIFGLFLLVDKEKTKVMLRLFYNRLLPEKLKKKAKITFHSFYEDMPKKRFFFIFFFLNLLNWIFIYFTNYIIGLSLGINLNFIYFLAIFPFATLVSLLPISINGLGTREAVLIGLFGLFGVSAAKVFSLSLISLLLMGILPSIFTSFILFNKC